MAFDVVRVRRDFPALALKTAHFDGPGGSQVPHQVAQAMADTLCSGISNRGGVTAAERRADSVVTGARAAVGDLLDCPPGCVVFARSMTQATYDMARAMAKQWREGDEVVVTRLDHDANIRPWTAAAEAAGATVRWADFDPATGTLKVDHVAEVLSPRTRLVAVTAASNLIGTRPDIPALAEAAHAVGALLYVDGVHLTPHAAVSLPGLGADFYACSPYKFFGPHHGLLAAARPELLEQVHPDKLLPSADTIPERFELGTLPYELLAGTTAAVDFIADLGGKGDGGDGGAGGGGTGGASRRARVAASMREVEAHEEALFDRLLDGLAAIGGVTVHPAPRPRTPTVLFSVAGHSPQAVYEHLAALGVNAPAGSFYAIEAATRLGLGAPGAVRAGISPYNDAGDVDRLLSGVRELAR
ncbi:cysteine desulfurase-like protein [Actinacidiphila rubida]|uniref:Cysteine desulfurase family protein, VC1184 subfamily n=1 Tax=Actinacidiphila rubida TaxID=310780 RepID=A0A1H8N5D6_9ACTN|nr:cysteine desulfurase-like protein [Actinacidiphila rubida]SEO24814.1 cysteine desulfurase family protein, VC1184 subfamily [Actinacidiphila rubida]